MNIFSLLLRLFVFVQSIAFIRSEHAKLSHIDKQHFVDMLRRMISHRKTSSVLTDCSINLAIDGLARIPQENSISGQIIRLVEQSFNQELHAIQQTVEKIRKNFFSTVWTLEKFRNVFSLDLRILLANQFRIHQIDVRLISSDNSGGSYLIKYLRKNSSQSNVIVDHELIDDIILQNDYLLQTFSTANLRETIKHDSQRLFTRHGWWLGPVLCEKNPQEVSLMAYVFPLINE